MPSAVLHWNDSGPTGGHRQHLIQGELGQFHIIGITYLFGEMGQLEAIGSASLEQLWAISKSSAVSHLRRAWPIPCLRHYLPLWINGPTQSYWQCFFGATVGHQQVIGSIWLWATPILSAVLI